MFENNDYYSPTTRSLSSWKPSSSDEVIRTRREADLDFFNASSRVPNPIQFLSTRLDAPPRRREKLSEDN